MASSQSGNETPTSSRMVTRASKGKQPKTVDSFELRISQDFQSESSTAREEMELELLENSQLSQENIKIKSGRRKKLELEKRRKALVRKKHGNAMMKSFGTIVASLLVEKKWDELVEGRLDIPKRKDLQSVFSIQPANKRKR